MESDSKEEDKTCEINADIIDKPTPQVSQEAADEAKKDNEDEHDAAEPIPSNRIESSTDDDHVSLETFDSKLVYKCEDLMPESEQLQISQFDDISDESRSDAVIGEERSTCITHPPIVSDSDVASINETDQSMDSIDQENVAIADNDVTSADNVHTSVRNDPEINDNVLNVDDEYKNIERVEVDAYPINNEADKCSPIGTETIKITKEAVVSNKCEQDCGTTLENVKPANVPEEGINVMPANVPEEVSDGINVEEEVVNANTDRENMTIQDAGCLDAPSSDADQYEAVPAEALTLSSRQSEEEKDVNFCEQSIAEKPDIANGSVEQKDNHFEDIEDDSFEDVTAISTDVKEVTSTNEEGIISKAAESNAKAHPVKLRERTALVEYESSGESNDEEEMEVDKGDNLLEKNKEHQTQDGTTSTAFPDSDNFPDSTKGCAAMEDNLCQDPENLRDIMLADKPSESIRIDGNEGKDVLEEHLSVTKETSIPASMLAEVEGSLPVDEVDIELNEDDCSSSQYGQQENKDIFTKAVEASVLNEPEESESSRDSNEAVGILAMSKSPEISSKEDFDSVKVPECVTSESHVEDIKTTNGDNQDCLEDRERSDDENSIEIIELDDEISDHDSDIRQIDSEAFTNDNVRDFENDGIESAFIDNADDVKDSLDMLSQQSDEGNEESLSAVAEFQSKPTPDWSMADDNAQSNDTELAISGQKCANGELQGEIDKLPAVAAEKDEQAECTTSSDLLEAGDEDASTEPPPSKRSRKGSIGSSANDASNDLDMMTEDYGLSVLPPENLFEYLWPPEQGGEFYMLQEQISEYLGIKSFKRKYPDLQRRPVEMKEKEFLRERGVVNETQCDLGLTALKSDEVHDLMHKDYPDRYQEYAHVLHEKERQTIRDKHREYGVPKLEKGKMAAYVKKAVKSAADFNSRLQKKRREERRAYFDLQTMAIHFPEGRYKKMDAEATKVSSYPVVLIPGQFQEFYQQYTSDELKYFPLQTTLYDPPKQFKSNLAKLSSGDSSEDMDDSAEDKSMSGSDDSDGSSDSDDSDGSKAKETDKDEASTAQPPVEPKVEPPSTPDPKTMRCRACNKGPGGKKRYYKAEEMVQCSECKQCGHPSCLQLSAKMVPVIKSYPWQCMECKTCVECMDPYDEDKMMFCDKCDRGYHTFCVGMKSLPKGCWECMSCTGEQPKSAKKIKRL